MTIMESTLHAVGRRVVGLAAALACGSALLWAATKGPDAGNYTATDEAIYSFADISGSSGGSGILSGTDDGTAVLTLPFPVRFYGQVYDLACVSTNGALYFVTAAAACSGYDGDFANTDLTVAPVPNDTPALLPLWSDLTFQVPGAGSVFYQTLGAAPDRRFVVQWHDAYPQGSGNPVTFQVVLAEGSTAILFQYLAVDLGSGNSAASGAQATVGIRNTAGVTNNQQIQWSYRAPVIHNSTAILFRTLEAGDAVPPAVTVKADPDNLWPANKKPEKVRVTGRITDNIGVASARYVVTDEYGLPQPSGPITLAANGRYRFTVSLVASRQPKDKDGRDYTIVVSAIDAAGNEGRAEAVVTVERDKGKGKK